MFGKLMQMFKGAPPEEKILLGDSPLREIPGLRLGSTVQIDTMAFRVLDLSFKAPVGDQSIEAYGYVDLGAGAALHRFYLMDDAWIQVNTQNGSIEDMKLFSFHHTQNPGTLAAFEKHVDPGAQMRQSELSYASRQWTRVWGEDEDAAPVAFAEKVYQASEPRRIAYEVQHFAMLFERAVPQSERMEYLLISAEDTSNEYAIVYSAGVDLGLDDLRPL